MHTLYRSRADVHDNWIPWPIDSFEGTPRTEVHILREGGSDGSILLAGIFRCDAVCRAHGELPHDETLHVISGAAEVTFDDGQIVELRPGDVVSWPRGAKTSWNVTDAPFSHFFVYSGNRED
jgi:uncharacterized cupin superfamily protein